jgi:large subunit ribosomal protein LP0
LSGVSRPADFGSSLENLCAKCDDLGNVGFIFTNADLKEIRTKILANRVAAPARAGAVAPLDVFIPAGNTGMEPGKTSFFQALGVPTKIARGTIEITTDLKLVEAGSKVGASEAVLLNMLNISPFTYGMTIAQIYDDGQTFGSDVLDIEDEQLLKSFSSAITTIASISLAVNYPTVPSVVHSVVNSYKKVLAIAIETEYSWPEIEELKDRIANPDKYAAAAPVAAATSGGDAPAAKEEAKEEEEEESGDEGEYNYQAVSDIFTYDALFRIRWSFRLNGLNWPISVTGYHDCDALEIVFIAGYVTRHRITNKTHRLAGDPSSLHLLTCRNSLSSSNNWQIYKPMD